MNKSVIFGLLLFTVGIQIGLQVYLSNRTKEVVAEQKPLKLEVNFKEEGEHHENVIDVKTQYASMTFTTKGATLSDLTCLRNMNGVEQTFTVLAQDQVAEREQQAFMVVLDDQTPYSYAVKSQDETETEHTLSYAVSTHEVEIEKNFIVYKNRPQIDLELTVKPHVPTAVRVMWPSPLLKGLGEDEVINGVMINQKDSFVRIPEKKIVSDFYPSPVMFGTEDKYFAFACIKDAQHFVQRAYYKNVNNRLLSLLEGPTITKETTWKLSFYFGPKEAASMVLVDKRLEKVFDYGLFSFITKPLLKLLDLVDGVVHNYGIAILLVTLLLKLLLLPFTWSGPKKMKRVEEFQRKMEYLNQKFKHDKQALEAARAEMVQKEGLPIAGCLPLLLQLPFLMALQSGLSNSLELYRAPFILWIKDLSVADPYYILPLLVVILFLMGGFMNQKGKSAKQNIGSFLMGLVFFAFTANLSAGLSLCILANIGLHTLQTEIQKVIGV